MDTPYTPLTPIPTATLWQNHLRPLRAIVHQESINDHSEQSKPKTLTSINGHWRPLMFKNRAKRKYPRAKATRTYKNAQVILNATNTPSSFSTRNGKVSITEPIALR